MNEPDIGAVRIYQSLLHSPLFLGVPREFMGFEGLAFLIWVGIFGTTRASMGMAAMALIPAHLMMRAFCARDRDGFKIFVEALGYRGFYPALGTLWPFQPVRVRRSVQVR